MEYANFINKMTTEIQSWDLDSTLRSVVGVAF